VDRGWPCFESGCGGKVRGAILKELTTLVLVIWQERLRMSNARVHYERATGGRATPTGRA
jgi:hypothetical protein